MDIHRFYFFHNCLLFYMHFRYSRNFKDANGTEFRTLYKAYGIKFVISVSGQARKFAPVPFLTNVGSGLALLSIVSLIKVPLFGCSILHTCTFVNIIKWPCRIKSQISNIYMITVFIYHNRCTLRAYLFLSVCNLVVFFKTDRYACTISHKFHGKIIKFLDKSNGFLFHEKFTRNEFSN